MGRKPPATLRCEPQEETRPPVAVTASRVAAVGKYSQVMDERQ